MKSTNGDKHSKPHPASHWKLLPRNLLVWFQSCCPSIMKVSRR